MRLVFTFSLLALTAIGCATTAARGQGETPEQLYQQALDDLDSGLHPEALEGFANIKTKYPYSKYAALADLRTADTHFERGKYLEAIDAYRSFIKFHPNHDEAPYAMFRIGEAYVEQMPSEWWFLPPAEEKDQGSTRLAISAFRDMLMRYPSSEHAAIAREQLEHCRHKLALHELYVARFYFDRERWVAAAARAEGLLRDYAGLGLDAQALWFAGRSRFLSKDYAAAAAALQKLRDSFPEDGKTKEAAAMLEEIEAARPRTAVQGEPQG